MRPIPHAMLIHAATLATAETDAYQTETLTTVAELSRVRVEPDETELTATDDTQVEKTALLLYDVRNSRPRGVAFAAGQRVVFEGVRYRVEGVEPLYDGRRLHHVEVTLRG
jgi:hypothetical protein